jgi:ABC-type transport system substrate-binding protein
MFNSPESMNTHGNSEGQSYTPVTWATARRGIFNPSGEFLSLLFERQGIVGENNDIYEVKLNENHTWHNGKPVTVDDMYYRDRLWYQYNKLTSEPGARFSEWTEIERVDDYTIRYHLHGPVNADLFLSEREMEPAFPRWDFKRWAEAMGDATTAQAAEQVLSQFNQQQRPLSEFIGNGAFQISEVNDTTVILEKYDEYPFADRNNIQQVKLHFVGGDAATRLKWQNGVPDYGAVPPGNVDLPDKYREVHYVENEGLAAQYNLENRHLAKRKFRQAINFMVDRRPTATPAGRSPRRSRRVCRP